MKVLFSPVGYTDPWRNNHDAAMLHIVRHYQPEKVVLFFSQSLWRDYQVEDKIFQGHQHYHWEKIVQEVSPGTQVEIKIEAIARPNDFDAYKELFRQYLKQIRQDYPMGEILLNITSGTPQMNATLCLEYVTNSKSMRCIQVSTPNKATNAQTSYDKPEYQELDFESVNQQELQSLPRYQEAEIITFRETMIKNELRSLVDAYDYQAAYFLLQQNKSIIKNANKIEKELTRIIEGIQTHTIFTELKVYKNYALQKILHHYLILEMRYRRRDDAEVLIRLKSIAEFVLNQYFQKNYRQFFHFGVNKTTLNLTQQEFKQVYESYLQEKNIPFYPTKALSLVDYANCLSILSAPITLIQQVEIILKMNDLRNQIAHNLEPLRLSTNQERQVLINAKKALNEMIKVVYPEVKEEVFSLFMQFNQMIKEELDEYN